MAQHQSLDFLAGVIEGFYGQPWSQAERFELFAWMASWGLNTYLYAPKDDLKHRACWRERYTATEAASLGELVRACNERDLRFIYALSPGLDIRYKDGAELVHLRDRFDQLLALGCQHFALLFDDIPDQMHAEDRKRFGSFASAQCHVANTLFQWVRERSPAARFLFCPTPYCGRMAERKLGGEGYLETVGRDLLPEIDVFWTGPEIISREITVSHAREIGTLLRRKPLIWDNLFANDYDGRRFFCGPYAGRPLELKQEVSGLLVNPNNEFPLNFVPLRTLGYFVNSAGYWDARFAFISALREWEPRFGTLGEPISFEDLESFCNCFYLPHEEGEDAERLFAAFRDSLSTPPAQWGERAAHVRNHAGRLRNFCVRMMELRDRPLFYALSRRIWELREELDLLERYVEFKSRPGNEDAAFGSDFHLPSTYRGGLVARLQRLLTQRSDGTFWPVQASDPARNPESDSP
jgi:protein O-GlcNAcase/histone acetyltransferase